MVLIRFGILAACLMLIVASCGCNDKEEHKFLEVSLSAVPLSGQAPLTVNFQGTAVHPDGNSVTYQWDFDDGDTSDIAAPSHVFLESGPVSYTHLRAHET